MNASHEVQSVSGTVVLGNYPCRRCHKVTPHSQIRAADRVVTEESLKSEKLTIGWRCNCGHLNIVGYSPSGYRAAMSGNGSGQGKRTHLRDSYRRERQFKGVGADYVDYGALKNVEAASGVTFSPGWKGTVDDMASHAQMTPEQVQAQWPVRPSIGRQPTLGELRGMGTIELSE